MLPNFLSLPDTRTLTWRESAANVCPVAILLWQMEKKSCTCTTYSPQKPSSSGSLCCARIQPPYLVCQNNVGLTDAIISKETSQGAARLLECNKQTSEEIMNIVPNASFIEKARPVGGAVNATEKTQLGLCAIPIHTGYSCHMSAMGTIPWALLPSHIQFGHGSALCHIGWCITVANGWIWQYGSALEVFLSMDLSPFCLCPSSFNNIHFQLLMQNIHCICC
jgi:hypothetical protein